MAEKIYPVLEEIANHAYINKSTYEEWYQESITNPEDFWGKRAELITWFKKWDHVLQGDFEKLNVQWFLGGELNASYNCLDRHLPMRANQAALIWEGDNPNDSKIVTYQALYEEVNRFANVLKQQGVKPCDRICIYLPMIVEAVVAMLACTRIGAVHSVVFGGFSAEALRARILDANCCLVITANEGVRGNKIIPLKENVDIALEDCQSVRNVIVVKHTTNTTPFKAPRDIWYHEAMQTASPLCPPEKMSANDPLFILYTSGSTGKPKGILHGTGGYLVYIALTFKTIFDYKEKEIYWCTADVGWITGHSYSVYGPLLNGATTLLFEGVPTYPTPSRFWEVIDKHHVNIFYTAPTAIRALRQQGSEWVEKTNRSSLRILGSVGEPINPAAWEWFFTVVGESRCPIVDTWWQTETGGIMISALPGATPLKAGSAAWPFFGIKPLIVNNEGSPVKPSEMGQLLITQPWPGMMQTIYGDHARFAAAYFSEFPGNYLTGDQAYQDEDGYYWIAGRSDDVIKVSGHRIGTQEVESALIRHQAVAEAAVVAIPDPIKGQHIYAFITLKVGFEGSEALKKGVIQTVREVIGAIAAPDEVQWVEGLPKTRSGKILRRLLRKIASDEVTDLGDLSTLADPSVIDSLLQKKSKQKP